MIEVTPSAATKVLEMMKREGQDPKKQGLRITVIPGGCAGYMYDMRFDAPSKKEDAIVHQNGVMILSDKKSAEFLKGSKMDYIESLQGSGFKIENPQVQHSCHCGKSVC